jgi:hypothetical protein
VSDRHHHSSLLMASSYQAHTPFAALGERFPDGRTRNAIYMGDAKSLEGLSDERMTVY